jgi:hypothetical protein
MSRPLLYLHLDRLEKAGLVHGSLEELAPFELRITADTVIAALRADEAADAHPHDEKAHE